MQKEELSQIAEIIGMQMENEQEKINSYERMLDSIVMKERNSEDTARYMMYYDLKEESMEKLRKMNDLKKGLKRTSQETA